MRFIKRLGLATRYHCQLILLPTQGLANTWVLITESLRASLVEVLCTHCMETVMNIVFTVVIATAAYIIACKVLGVAMRHIAQNDIDNQIKTFGDKHERHTD